MNGLCECGCGGQTAIAAHNDARHGYVKGEPRRFINGHAATKGHRYVSKAIGHVLVFAPTHPRASRGYVLEHVLVVEKAMGKYLPAGAVVHHVNTVRSDNRNVNLVALQNQSEHRHLHIRLRVLRAGGNPWTQRICSVCKAVVDMVAFYVGKDGRRRSDCQDCSKARFAAHGRQQRAAAKSEAA